MKLLKSLFKFKTVAEHEERLFGFALRFLGIDFLVTLNGWLNDYTLFDIRVLRFGGTLVYLQVLGIVLWVGRNSLLWEDRETLSV